MDKKKSIPHTFSGLAAWLSVFIKYLREEHLRFGISEAEILPFINEAEDFLRACEKAELPDAGKAERTERGWKGEYINRSLREFVNTRLRSNKAVTNEDIVRLGLSTYNFGRIVFRKPYNIQTDSVIVADIKYLPHPYDLLTPWVSNFVDYLRQESHRFDIPEAEVLSIIRIAEGYLAASEKAYRRNPNSFDKVKRIEHAIKIREMIPLFVKSFLRDNKAVTGEDLVRFGLTVRAPRYHPAPKPADTPESSTC
jgi:hypothetical protein